jgi:transposase-like protein
MKSERITILVSPEEKAQIVNRARALKLPTGEWVRRAATRFDVNDETKEEELALLADELDRTVTATEKKLDHALAKLNALQQATRADSSRPEAES